MPRAVRGKHHMRQHQQSYAVKNCSWSMTGEGECSLPKNNASVMMRDTTNGWDGMGSE
jgi:hypothetical protein